MDMKSQSKLKALKELNKVMKDMMGEEVKSKIGGLKKVTVAASNAEDLKKGLNKAEEILDKPSLEEVLSDEDSQESDEHEMQESEEMENEEENSDKKMSKEDIMAQIEKLKAALADCE